MTDCEGTTGVDFGSKVGRLAAGDTPEGENDGLACFKGARAGRGVGCEYGIMVAADLSVVLANECSTLHEHQGAVGPSILVPEHFCKYCTDIELP